MKKYLKYIFIILIINIVAICLGQTSIYATNITMELNTNKDVYDINENVIVTINWGQEMQAADFVLQYDTTKLQFISSSIGQDFYKVNGNQIIVSWASIAEQAAQEVKLTNMTFTFKAIGKGETAISIVSVESIADANLVIPDQIDYTSRGSKTINIVNAIEDINRNAIALTTTKNNFIIDDDIIITLKGINEIKKYSSNNFALNYDITKLTYTGAIGGFTFTDSNGNINLNTSLSAINSDEISLCFKAKTTGTSQTNLIISLLDGRSDTISSKNVNITGRVIINDNLNVVNTNNAKLYISGFSRTDITVNNLIENFNNEYQVSVCNFNNTTLSNNEKVCTGTNITVNDSDNSNVFTYYIVIYGDTNGDGYINAVDALAIIKNKLSILNFSDEIFSEAGRVTQNTRNSKEVPSAVDALAIVKHKLGVETITQ